MTIIGDDEDRSHWPMDSSIELGRINEVLQMTGIDTTQPLPPPQFPSRQFSPRRSFQRTDVDDPPTPPDRGES
ncbi:hypothetical protein [Caballeronia sp. LZ001]|uniref:hypothetical protein n=1 Tax=Caballeronia sp. LZ001 TaxID=3038553 RepID=UPI0028638037|nr:hypothetical protein [Caballeronia sp. LZ001]MDR5806650.1 hypothetical protein [Caballeronia sp. LZ001]